MIKKRFALLTIAFLMLSILALSITTAVDITPSGKGIGVPKSLENLLTNWEKGEGVGETGAKWLFLILIAALIYAVFTSISFPDNVIIRLIISIIVSFLATFLLTPGEIYGLLASYTGLGITISLFLPIIILVFLTIVVSAKGAPIGVFFTKILWLIYGVYMLLKGALIFMAKEGLGVIKSGIDEAGSPIYRAAENGGKQVLDGDWEAWFEPVIQVISEEMYAQAYLASAGIGILMFVIGAAAIYFGVMKSNWLDAWIKKGMTESQVATYKDKLKKSTEFTKAQAEALEEGAGK